MREFINLTDLVGCGPSAGFLFTTRSTRGVVLSVSVFLSPLSGRSGVAGVAEAAGLSCRDSFLRSSLERELEGASGTNKDLEE